MSRSRRDDSQLQGECGAGSYGGANLKHRRERRPGRGEDEPVEHENWRELEQDILWRLETWSVARAAPSQDSPRSARDSGLMNRSRCVVVASRDHGGDHRRPIRTSLMGQAREAVAACPTLALKLHRKAPQ
jgi:hypothetical protein